MITTKLKNLLINLEKMKLTLTFACPIVILLLKLWIVQKKWLNKRNHFRDLIIPKYNII